MQSWRHGSCRCKPPEASRKPGVTLPLRRQCLPGSGSLPPPTAQRPLVPPFRPCSSTVNLLWACSSPLQEVAGSGSTHGGKGAGEGEWARSSTRASKRKKSHQVPDPEGLPGQDLAPPDRMSGAHAGQLHSWLSACRPPRPAAAWCGGADVAGRHRPLPQPRRPTLGVGLGLEGLLGTFRFGAHPR